MELEERLNNRINELEEQIEQFKEKEEERANKLKLRERAWSLSRNYAETSLTKDLPVPRMEMQLEPDGCEDWSRVKWTYGLVLQPYAQAYGTTRIRQFMPYSITLGSGKYHILENGKLDKPCRDNINMQGDMFALKLPGFIVCEKISIVEQIEIELPERFEKLVQS